MARAASEEAGSPDSHSLSIVFFPRATSQQNLNLQKVSAKIRQSWEEKSHIFRHFFFRSLSFVYCVDEKKKHGGKRRVG